MGRCKDAAARAPGGAANRGGKRSRARSARELAAGPLPASADGALLSRPPKSRLGPGVRTRCRCVGGAGDPLGQCRFLPLIGAVRPVCGPDVGIGRRAGWVLTLLACRWGRVPGTHWPALPEDRLPQWACGRPSVMRSPPSRGCARPVGPAESSGRGLCRRRTGATRPCCMPQCAPGRAGDAPAGRPQRRRSGGADQPARGAQAMKWGTWGIEPPDEGPSKVLCVVRPLRSPREAPVGPEFQRRRALLRGKALTMAPPA